MDDKGLEAETPSDRNRADGTLPGFSDEWKLGNVSSVRPPIKNNSLSFFLTTIWRLAIFVVDGRSYAPFVRLFDNRSSADRLPRLSRSSYGERCNAVSVSRAHGGGDS